MSVIDTINTKLKYYNIEPHTTVLGEDGKYLESIDGTAVGYAAISRITGQVEFTSQALPTLLYQAQYFDNVLDSIIHGAEPVAAPIEVDGDVILN